MRHTIILISEIIDNINDNIYTFECVENKLIGLYKDLLESSYNIEAYINTYDLNDGKNRVYDNLLDVATLYQRRTSNFITHTNKAISPEQIIIPPSSELYWLIRKFITSKIALHKWGTANKFRKYINTKENEIMTNEREKYLCEIVEAINNGNQIDDVVELIRNQISRYRTIIGDVGYIEYIETNLLDRLSIWGRGNAIMFRDRAGNIYDNLRVLKEEYRAERLSNLKEVQPIKKIEGSQSKSDSCTFATVLITLSDSEKESIIERIKGIINPNIKPKNIAIILVALKQMQLLTLSNISLLARVWYNEFGSQSALKSLETGLSNHISGDHTKFERDNKDDIEFYKNQLQQ
ncbi:MAG: hypothetical protein SNJ10_09605 [Rikenellaceae bacterium]